MNILKILFLSYLSLILIFQVQFHKVIHSHDVKISTLTKSANRNKTSSSDNEHEKKCTFSFFNNISSSNILYVVHFELVKEIISQYKIELNEIASNYFFLKYNLTQPRSPPFQLV